MDTAEPSPNAAEIARWNADPGRAWAEHQTAMDATHTASQALLMAAARLAPGQRVLDIGCGTGASTLAAAAAVAPQGTALGLDVSAPLLATARARAAAAGVPAAFRELDIQTAAPDRPPPGGAPGDLCGGPFDRAISRFGVMFFSDPAAAFARIAAALVPGGRAAFLAWGPLEANPWFAVPRAAAVARLGTPAPRDPHAPGPLAFADPARAGALLEAGGLRVETAAHRDVALTPPGGIEGAAALAFRFGPAGRILEEKGGTEADIAAVRRTIADGLARYATPAGMAIPARLTLLTALRPRDRRP